VITLEVNSKTTLEDQSAVLVVTSNFQGPVLPSSYEDEAAALAGFLRAVFCSKTRMALKALL